MCVVLRVRQMNNNNKTIRFDVYYSNHDEVESGVTNKRNLIHKDGITKMNNIVSHRHSFHRHINSS